MKQNAGFYKNPAFLNYCEIILAKSVFPRYTVQGLRAGRRVYDLVRRRFSMRKCPIWYDYLMITLTALLMAASYALFVFPNAFAPAGVNGIITMVQYVFHISIGYLALAINLPLIFLAWKKVGHAFAVRSLVFVVVFSAASLILKSIDLSGICYHTDNGTSLILGPIMAGAISGYIYGVVLYRGGSTGGMDIIAAWVRSKHPEASFVWIIFCLNVSVAAVSFFVYGYQFEPVIMCLIYCYVSSQLSDQMLRGSKKALKCEVITDQAEALSETLLQQMHHGVTVIPAEGMYSKTEKKLLLCIVNKHQIVQFQRILAQFPGTFSYVSEVTETLGNFKYIKK